MDILIEEIHSHLDAFDVYSLFKNQKNIILLDSGMDEQNFGRYSFMGLNPYLTVKGRDNHCLVNDKSYTCDIFTKLSQLLQQYKAPNPTELPFIGGCIGYLAYDLGLTLEQIQSTAKEDLIIPHYYFIFYDNLFIMDHKTQRQYLTACGVLQNPGQSIKQLKQHIQQGEKVVYPSIPTNKAPFSSNFTKPQYLAAIRKLRQYIENGDIYIANLTQQLSAHTAKDTYDIYRDLRHINPAPFASLMRLQGFDVISSSPERFLKIINNQVETRPIKGTRPRGKSKAEDDANRLELLHSEKDKAELLMIVDLERNDLSKVCKPHSVKVTELFTLEEYSTVFHLVSTVVGELQPHVDAVHCLKACFPGGSITGTPKIRAMEIIDELEGLKRSLYTGCIGYFSLDGNADFNIIIRTMIKKDDCVYFGVGGGITWDSKEEEEYQETLDKAKALLGVL